MNSEKIDEIHVVNEKFLKDRSEFNAITRKTLEEIDTALIETQKKCTTIEETVRSIRELSEHPQATSYLRICKLGYIEATVKHTGEYNVELGQDYQCTLTADQTVEFLEEMLAGERSILTAYNSQKDQLERRLNLNFEVDVDDPPDTEGMPDEIRSDRGVAFKHGSFFEIVENEPDVVYQNPKHRTSRIKT